MTTITYKSVIDGRVKTYDTDELRIKAQRPTVINANYYKRINDHLRMLWVLWQIVPPNLNKEEK